MFGGASPSFSVHKNAVNQTPSGLTIVTWSTEIFDTNGNFASDAFIPTVPGKYEISVSLLGLLLQDGESIVLHIYKNGVSFKTSFINQAINNNALSTNVIIVDDANGVDDDYAVRCSITSNRDFSGLATSTYFSGSRIG